MRHRIILRMLACAATAGTPAAALAAQAERPAPADLVIRDVTVVDVDRGALLPGRTVLVDDGRIRAVVPATDDDGPAATVAVQGRGLYLVPGLWDMHAHVLPAGAGSRDWWEPDPVRSAALLLANGVTGVRDMWGSLEAAAAWRARGSAVPRLVAPGGIVDGPYPWFPELLSVGSGAQARRVVDSLAAGGADFIKIYNALPPDLLPVIVDRARAHGLTVSGHVPDAMPVRDAAGAGMASFEHLHGVLEGCSRDESWLLRDNVAYLDARAAGRPAPDGNRAYLERLLETQDEARCADLIARLARLGVAQVPTLVAHRGPLRLRDPAAGDDPRLAYVPEEAARFWQPGTYGATRGFGVSDWRLAERRIHRMQEVIGKMRAAGVPILAGSDVHPTLAFTFPGFSLHEELELLVASGLSPGEALRAATSAAADFLGAGDRLGRVNPGFAADLVLLRGDPLSDIRHTREIEGVVREGRWFPRDTLDAWLGAVADEVRLPDRPRLPALPGGAAEVEASERRAEFRYLFLVDPDRVESSIPTFASPLRAREMAASDPGLDSFLGANPGFAAWAVSGFEIGSYEHDGRRLREARWWVAIRDPGLAPAGSGTPGAAVELARWRGRGPGAAGVDARRYGSGTWSFHLEGLELVIDVVCRPGGARWHETATRDVLLYPGDRIPDRYFRLIEAGETRRDCGMRISAEGLSPLAAALSNAPAVTGRLLGARLVEGGERRRGTYRTD